MNGTDNPHLALALNRMMAGGYEFASAEGRWINVSADNAEEIFTACSKVGLKIESIAMLEALMTIVGFEEEAKGHYVAPESWLDDLKLMIHTKLRELMESKPSTYSWRGRNNFLLHFGRELDAITDLALLGLNLEDFATLQYALMLVKKSFHGPEKNVGYIWELPPLPQS